MRYRMVVLMAAASWPAIAAAQDVPPVRGTPPIQTAPATGAAPAESTTSDEPDIIVTGQRNLPGAVIGDIKPELQLGPADIRSYGVSSISDLLTELAPQTRSGAGGAPVVLLDGKRIAGFQELRDIPTEAIARVDILPEEVALKYGYTADQRVVNFVLRRRFRSTTVEVADRIATAGGTNTPNAELGLLTIQNGKRVNLNAEYSRTSALTEAERDILPGATESGTTGFDQRPFRTLLPETRTASVNAVYARPIGNVSATINGEIETSDSIGRFGLPSAAFTVPAGNPFATTGATTGVSRVLDGGDFTPLAQRSSSITAHLGTNFNGRVGDWQWTLTGAYDRIGSETFTETGVDATAFQARLNANDPAANPAGPFAARDFGALAGTQAYSTSSTGALTALVNGTLFSLPAGDVSTSIRVGGTTSDFDSRSVRLGVTQRGMVSRDIVNGRVNIDVPIADESKGVLGFLGDLSVNANVAADSLSDFGTLVTYGYGATWTPVTGVRVIGSISDTDEAPSATQLGAPTVVTPNARVFDYVRGLTATVARTTGGNAALIEDDRRLEKLGVTIKPWTDKDLTLTANYTGVHVDDPIAAFPTPTAAIEAAFPNRFVRDPAGNLLSIDARPINYARTDRTELRWGVNFSMALKSKIQKQIEAFRAGTGPNPFAGLRFPGAGGQQRPAGGGQPGAGAPGGGAPGGGFGGPGGGGFRGGPGGGPGGGGFGGGGFGGGRGGQGGGRLQFAVYHTWHFTDRVLIADGGPRLDLLDGDAIGANGGSPRHELEGQAGYSNNGLGARLSVNWQSGTRVDGGTAVGAQTLAFSGLTTANLRLFADLGQRLEWVKAHPWLRGMRVTVGLENVLDSRQRVTDAAGTTPISYQSDYLNPLGRTVRISVRKLFF